MSAYGYGNRRDLYVGGTGSSGVSVAGFLLGIGLAFFVVALPMIFRWPIKWAVVVMTAALLTGAGICWICRRLDWPFLPFFKAFTCMILPFWSLVLNLGVIEKVTLWNTGHLKVISIALAIWAGVKLFRWEKKHRDMGRASVLLAVIIGFFCFSLCHSALVGINVFADRRGTQQTAARVIRVEQGRRAAIVGRVSHSYTVYFVRVAENDLTEAGRFPIDKTLYDTLEPGDEVRLVLHPGALGAPWLECVPNED